MRYKAKVELEAYEQLLLKLIYKSYMFATINDVVGICIMHQGNILVTLTYLCNGLRIVLVNLDLLQEITL